jgi:hypothetical protein
MEVAPTQSSYIHFDNSIAVRLKFRHWAVLDDDVLYRSFSSQRSSTWMREQHFRLANGDLSTTLLLVCDMVDVPLVSLEYYANKKLFERVGV